MVLQTALLVLLYLILQHAGKSFFATVPIFRVYLKNYVFTVVPVEFVVLLDLLRFHRPNLKHERCSEHIESPECFVHF